MTPEEKLCSRFWRLRNSAGVLWGVLSFGLLTGVGFLIRGVKAQNKLWIVLGIGFLVVGIGLMTTAGVNEGTKDDPVQTTAGNIWGWVWFTSFIGGVVTAFITNRKWLIWKAHSKETKWYATAGASHSTTKSSPSAGYYPSGETAASGPLPAPPPPSNQHNNTLSINTASASTLMVALGLDAPTANRIIEARQPLGSFTSFEQLMSKAQVPPHLLIPHRGTITFDTPSDVPAPQPEPPSTGSKSARILFD